MTRFPLSSPSPTTFVSPPRGSTTRGTTRLRPVVPAKNRQSHDQHLLTEDLFTHALAREFKRADRCEESFALLVISLSHATAAAGWSELVDVLMTSKSDADVMGWFKEDVAIGLIRPLVHLEPSDAAAALAATVQRQLARTLTRESTATCSIRLEVYSPRSQAVIPVGLDGGMRRPTPSMGGAAPKRALDVAGSLLCLGLLAPVFLLISGLIKLTATGPIMFRQQRVGRGGRPFTMLKFRTMHVNADPAIHQQYVDAVHPVRRHCGIAARKTVFKIVDDPRVTPVGHFLRRTSLDELPQFWNVLRGDMSLVGPRPPLPYEVARYKRWHRRRVLEAKPGITGLWQVTGRSRTTFDDMVRLDLRYARSYSLWTDIKILLATPRAVVSGNGAH